MAGSFFCVVGFGAEENQVHNSDIVWGIGGAGGLDDEIAELALDLKPATTNCLKVRAPRNEGDLVSSLRKQATVIPPNAACSYDHYLHASLPNDLA